MDVHKFGGVSTSDPKGIQRIFEIISQETKPVIFTVSASYGITKYLHELLYLSPIDLDIPKIITFLKVKHINLLNSSKKIIPELDLEISKLERLLYGIAYTEEITPRTRDLILSFGERLITIVIKEYFQIQGLNPKVISPEKLIITNGIHYSSNILLEETSRLCQEYMKNEMEDDDILIVPGYFGVSKNNITTLLGRSGTDYTATSLGYGFKAEAVIIWKDVLGFMSADPSIVQDARTISELTYDEAAELSYFGAQILHPRCVLPSKMKRTPIFIKNLYNDGIFTKIHHKSAGDNKYIAKSVSHLSELAIIRIYKYTGGSSEGTFFTIAEKLFFSHINILSIATSQTCISILIKKDQKEASMDGLNSLKSNFIETIECEDDIALICVVGEGLGNTPGIASRVFNSIKNKNINVVMISSGASKVAFHFTVKQNDLDRALSAIHNEFYPKLMIKSS